MHANRADLTDIFQTGELKALARIGRLEDAASDDDIRSNGGAARADPHMIGIGWRDIDRSDRPGRDLAITDRIPGDPGVIGLPHTAASRALIEGLRLLPHAGKPRDASTTRCAHVAPSEIFERERWDELVDVALGLE